MTHFSLRSHEKSLEVIYDEGTETKLLYCRTLKVLNTHTHTHTHMAKCSVTLTGEGVHGALTLFQSQEEAATVIEGSIGGLTPGKHGFAIPLLQEKF